MIALVLGVVLIVAFKNSQALENRLFNFRLNYFGLRVRFANLWSDLTRRFQRILPFTCGTCNCLCFSDGRQRHSAMTTAPVVASEAVCGICLEPSARADAGLWCCISADQRHFTCGPCLEEHAKTECATGDANIQALIARNGQLLCPSARLGCTSAAFTEHDLARHLSAPTFARVIEARVLVGARHAEAQTTQRVHRVLIEQGGAGVDRLRNELIAEDIRSAYRNADGSYNAYMCPSCEFGPVAHMACSSLGTHHGQNQGNARINNACPRCGWFGDSISKWRRWDGRVPVEESRGESQSRSMAASVGAVLEGLIGRVST